MENRKKLFSVLITHYGNPFWALNAIESLKFNRSEFQIFVLDNSGNFPLSVDYKVIETWKLVDGEDSLQHAQALDWAIKHLRFQSTYLMTCDSDVMFFGHGDLVHSLRQLLEKYEAIVALREGSRFLTHPCFTLFRVSDAKNMTFSEGMREFGFDTGTLIGLSLARKGVKVKKMKAEKFDGSPIGYLYKEIGLIHLTSSSLSYMSRRFAPNNFQWKLKVEMRRKLAERIVKGKRTGRFGITVLLLRTVTSILISGIGRLGARLQHLY